MEGAIYLRSQASQLVCTGAITFVLVGAVRHYALARQILDIPNERSSHSLPVPRGGGLGFLTSLLVITPLLVLPAQWSVALVLTFLALAAVGAVGWIDDRRGLPVRYRLAVHVAAGVCVAALVSTRAAGPLWMAWWVFWSVACINVVNFMDGIDGLVASQCAIFGIVALVSTPTASLAHVLALVTVGASIGFLLWNWSPARIFLGDVGSGTVGLVCASIGALATRESDIGIERAFLPLFPLFLDATWTLMRRARNGERVSTPHRSHLYQRLANGGWGHARVAALYGAAAAAGGGVALLPRSESWTVIAAAYAVIVWSIGASLDRTRPFVWRTRTRG